MLVAYTADLAVMGTENGLLARQVSHPSPVPRGGPWPCLAQRVRGVTTPVNREPARVTRAFVRSRRLAWLTL